MSKEIPIEELPRLLRYEPETGLLFWRERLSSDFSLSRIHKMWNTRYADQEAFTASDGLGYKRGAINNNSLLAHRVVFALHHGHWPSEVDHINGDSADNRLENLREVSHVENLRNCKKSRSNTSGIVGVCWDNAAEKWLAQIGVDNRRVCLGRFATFKAAAAARKQAEREHGFSERHGTHG